MMRKFKKESPEINPEDIFSDALNIPGFDEGQFEGMIERPISRRGILIVGGIFLAVLMIFAGRAGFLQIIHGHKYKSLSELNSLKQIPVFSKRGIIYDRNGVELAWNIDNPKAGFYQRVYTERPGFAHILGYVSLPKLDQSGRFWQTESIGKEGVERFYDFKLKGVNGAKLIELDVYHNIVSESTVKPPKDGENLTLTIDARLQEELYKIIERLSNQVGFQGGAAAIMDVWNGELLALVSFPEYDGNKLSLGKDHVAIERYLKDSRTPFVNRAVSGLYTPGSTVKPFMALAALSEGIIDPLKKILSTGSISIPNPYNPSKPSIYRDWKVHGWVDMRRAIAVSSDVYFYTIGGGFGDQVGLGIEKIEKYARIFGFGEKTGVDLPLEMSGVIPNPEWKERNFGGEKWFLGNTYHTVIGQYGFQITPLELVRGIAAIANGGTLVTPHVRLVKDTKDANNQFLNKKDIFISPEHIQIVKDGMYSAVTDEGGTSQGLYTPNVSIAAKTGTAELGIFKDKVNSWVTGFFPYEKPKYAFVVVMEKGPRENTLGGVYVMRQFFDWLVYAAPEYIDSK